MKSFHWVFLGAWLGLAAVATGAFGDHLLKPKLGEWYGERGPHQLENWQTASRYLMYHALALVALGCLPARGALRSSVVAGVAFLAGCLLFSGGLFAHVLSDVRWLVHLVPLGGVALLIGWFSLAVSALAANRQELP